jgi:uncharacterized RDD family membrane protein YckC
VTETGPPPPPGYPGQSAPGYTPPQGASGPRANFGYRLVAALIDGIIVSIVYWLVWAIVNETLASIVALVVGIAYYTYLEGSPSGQTVGKKIMNIRVIDFGTGGPIGYGRAVGRYFARILSSIPCFLGYLWMLWDREKQTWHDKLVTSVVVPTDAYPVERWPG